MRATGDLRSQFRVTYESTQGVKKGSTGDLRSQFRVTDESTEGLKKGSHKIDVKVTSPTGEARRGMVHQVGPTEDKSRQKEQKSK